MATIQSSSNMTRLSSLRTTGSYKHNPSGSGSSSGSGSNSESDSGSWKRSNESEEGWTTTTKKSSSSRNNGQRQKSQQYQKPVQQEQQKQIIPKDQRFSKPFKQKADSKSLGIKNIKGAIRKGLMNYTGPTDLIAYVKSELSNLTGDDADKFLETTISWSLHEIFEQDSELLKRLKTIHTTGKHKIIHWALWPRYRTHPHELQDLANFTRTEQDILDTIKLCLDVKSDPLETNEKGESAIMSLTESFKKQLITAETYSAAYKLFTQPSTKNMESMCRNFVLQLSHSGNTTKNIQKSPILSWMICCDPAIFCQVLVTVLVSYPSTHYRDKNGFYKLIHDRIGHVESILKVEQTGNKTSNHDFDKFFAENYVSQEKLVAKFHKAILQLCLESDTNKLESLLIGGEEKINKIINYEIIGAIIGEIADDQTVLSFCRTLKEKDIDVMRVLLVHKKHNTPKFNCPEDLVDKFVDAYKRTPESFSRFQIISGLEKILGRKISDIENMKRCINKESKPEVTKTTNIKTMITLKVNIKGICRLKDEQVTFDGQQYIPEFIDDVVYDLSKLYDLAKENGTEHHLSEMVIANAMETIISQKQIEAFVKILTDKSWITMIQSVVSQKGQQLLENIRLDNPEWAEKVMNAFVTTRITTSIQQDVRLKEVIPDQQVNQVSKKAYQKKKQHK